MVSSEARIFFQFRCILVVDQLVVHPGDRVLPDEVLLGHLGAEVT